MKVHNETFSVDQMAKVLGVSRSGYYDFLKRPKSCRSVENEDLLNKIRSVFQDSYQTYGSPRIHAALQAQGIACSRPRVARLMKAQHIQAKMYKKFHKTTRPSLHPYHRGEDLVQQNFSAPLPNQVWATDITYIKVNKKWCYLAVIIDLYSRKVVGMALQDHMRVELILEALNAALLLRRPPTGLIHHSDLGSQYTSHDLAKKAAVHKIRLSHGKTGCAYDNAAMESFFHTLKTELVYFKSYQTLQEAKMDIFAYIFTFYNQKRKHSTLNYQSPNQYEWNNQLFNPVSIQSVR